MTKIHHSIPPPSCRSPGSRPLSRETGLHFQGPGCLPPTVSPPFPPCLCPPAAQAWPGLAASQLHRAATHRFLGMMPDSCAAGVAVGAAVAADAALRALHSLVLTASWGRPSRWPERTRSLRPARSRSGSGSRSRSGAEPEPAPVPPAAAAASAMASALCRRPGPLGAGERSLRAAPGATIRCGASRQPPRRLGGGCHAPGASVISAPAHRARPPPAVTPRMAGTCRAGEFELSRDWPRPGWAELNQNPNHKRPEMA